MLSLAQLTANMNAQLFRVFPPYTTSARRQLLLNTAQKYKSEHGKSVNFKQLSKTLQGMHVTVQIL